MRTPAIILALLVLPWLAALLLWPSDAARAELFGLAGLVLAFAFFSLGHFAMTGQMVEMLPRWVPLRRPIVLATGVMEAGIALALMLPASRVAAGWASIAVLIGFFPVNVYASLTRRGGGGHEWGPVYLLLRLPLQLLLVAWCILFAL
ncbi:hypothetical protein [Pseudoroseicyclus sp. CXY001]|uniref:DoxX family protein n=1 Tax=Pseudoroseicyclus sp. CXY001 TaxID=3242492 RepID=UPI003570DFC1